MSGNFPRIPVFYCRAINLLCPGSVPPVYLSPSSYILCQRYFDFSSSGMYSKWL